MVGQSPFAVTNEGNAMKSPLLLPMRQLRGALVLVAMLVALIALPGPVAAYQEVYTHGAHGNYFFDDSSSMPAVTCKYGPVVYSNWAYLKWVEVRAPHVWAADRNSDVREHRLISWSYKLQRATFSNQTTWTNVASSAVQKATAYEDVQAPLSALRVKYNAEAKLDPNHQGSDSIFRVLATIKWIKGGGAVEATVRVVATYFRVVDPRFTLTSSQTWCQAISTDG
jgi:hypothetical protein